MLERVVELGELLCNRREVVCPARQGPDRVTLVRAVRLERQQGQVARDMGCPREVTPTHRIQRVVHAGDRRTTALGDGDLAKPPRSERRLGEPTPRWGSLGEMELGEAPRDALICQRRHGASTGPSIPRPAMQRGIDSAQRAIGAIVRAALVPGQHGVVIDDARGGLAGDPGDVLLEQLVRHAAMLPLGSGRGAAVSRHVGCV